MEKVLQYIDAHRDEYIGLLQTFCRQPSIAATGEGIREMAALVGAKLRDLGVEPTVFETKGNPILYAEIKGRSPRIFGFYGHYDVQPVDPIELWEENPFSAVIKDGVLYARGCVDNKNGIAAKIAAVDAWQKVYGELPCAVRFFVEGEEEIGSPNLKPFAESHRDLLRCDGFHWESGWKQTGEPAQIEFGVKGMLYVELRVKYMDADCHSGDAGIVPSAAWRLVHALSTLKGEDDRILIDGFYEDIPPLSEADIAILDQDPYNEEAQKRAYGIQSFIGGLTGKDLLKKHYYEPTLNIAGLCAGYTGKGEKTVLPAEATVKMDFRLVPGQSPQKVFDLLCRHLHQHGYDDVEVKCCSMADAYRSDPDSPYARAVVSALGKLFGKPIVHHTLAGTSPMPTFCVYDNVPVASFGGTCIGANMHAPNEHVVVDSFVDEIKMIAAVMNELAAMPD